MCIVLVRWKTRCVRFVVYWHVVWGVVPHFLAKRFVDFIKIKVTALTDGFFFFIWENKKQTILLILELFQHKETKKAFSWIPLPLHCYFVVSTQISCLDFQLQLIHKNRTRKGRLVLCECLSFLNWGSRGYLASFSKKEGEAGTGHCRNVRGLGKSMVVFRLFEKLRYSNERSTIF